MITVKKIFVPHAGVDKPYGYEKPFTVASPEDAMQIANQNECVYFKDTDAPTSRNWMLTPLGVFPSTVDGFHHLTKQSFRAWEKTLEGNS